MGKRELVCVCRQLIVVIVMTGSATTAGVC